MAPIRPPSVKERIGYFNGTRRFNMTLGMTIRHVAAAETPNAIRTGRGGRRSGGVIGPEKNGVPECSAFNYPGEKRDNDCNSET